MDIQIAGRNIEVSNALRDRIEKKLGPILADYPRVESCRVVLAIEKFRNSASITVQGRDKMHIEALDTSDENMYAAIDAAILRADKQLRRSREKMLDRQKNRERLVEAEGTPPPPEAIR